MVEINPNGSKLVEMNQKQICHFQWMLTIFDILINILIKIGQNFSDFDQKEVDSNLKLVKT